MNTPEQKKRIQAFMAALRREQRKPEARAFPKFIPGMTTGDYIRRFNALNGNTYCPRITLDFESETLAREAAFYDPLTPLCLEEMNDAA
jgi:hypothetical protein